VKWEHISQFGALGWLAALNLLRSNFLFSLGFAVFWIGMLAFSGGVWTRRVIVVLMHMSSLVYAVIITGAHQFFAVTGSSLDYSLIALAFTSFNELKPVMASEVSFSSFAVICAYILFVPALLTSAASRFHLILDTPRVSDPSRRLALYALPAAGVLLLLASVPASGPLGKSFARDPFLHVFITALDPPTVDSADRLATSIPAVGTTLIRKSSGGPTNIALVILESTGTSSVTPYNKDIATTPYLDELAEKSLLVERAYSTVPHTSKALVSIVCGIEPRPIRSITESLPGMVPATCLPELLRQQGYRTVFFQSATEFFQDRRQLVANFGYADFYPGESMNRRGFERANYFGFEDDIMLEPSREWLGKNGTHPFLATYLTNTPHHQYLAPGRYGSVRFAQREEHNRYLNSVRYLDFFVRNLIEQYKQLGLYDETIFVIVGDHGEAFGEHHRSKHDNILYEEVMRVPLLIHSPAIVSAGERVTGPASLLDILPTAIGLLGFEIAKGSYPGSSIFSLPRDRPLYFSCFHDRKCLGSLNGWRKFIHHYGDQPDELFDLLADPLERENLAAQANEDVSSLRAELQEWRANLDATYKQHRRDQLEPYLFDSRPRVQHEVEAVFARHLALVGYDLSETKLKPGQTFEITYYFEVRQRIPSKWRMVVEAWGEEGNPGQNNQTERLRLGHQPLDGLYRLRFWKPGQYVADAHTVTVPETWQSPSFNIRMGFLNKRRERAVNVRTRQPVEEGLVTVARITVLR
ncbi:MAG: LTA synthase family protein, partial [Vicinamibacteria bacterium]